MFFWHRVLEIILSTRVLTNLQILPVRHEVVVVELLARFVAFLLLDHLQVVEDLLHLEALVEADLEVSRDIFEVFIGRLQVFRVVLARWLKVPENRSLSSSKKVCPRKKYCRSLIKVKFPTDQIRPALGSCCRLFDC